MGLPESPIAGHYSVRFRRGGPFVACRIVEADGAWLLFVGGDLVGGPETEPWAIPMMEAVAFARRRISDVEYDAMLSAAAAAPEGDPLTAPGAAVDLRRAPPLYRKRGDV